MKFVCVCVTVLLFFSQSAAGERKEETRAGREREGADRTRKGRADREAEADRRADAESSERFASLLHPQTPHTKREGG